MRLATPCLAICLTENKELLQLNFRYTGVVDFLEHVVQNMLLGPGAGVVKFPVYHIVRGDQREAIYGSTL